MHLNSTDLVSNIHPMEIRSALLLRITCAWVFLAHKVYSLFWTGYCLYQKCQWHISYCFFTLEVKKKKMYLQKDLQRDFFKEVWSVFSHLIQCILLIEIRSFVLALVNPN